MAGGCAHDELLRGVTVGENLQRLCPAWVRMQEPGHVDALTIEVDLRLLWLLWNATLCVAAFAHGGMQTSRACLRGGRTERVVVIDHGRERSVAPAGACTARSGASEAQERTL